MMDSPPELSLPPELKSLLDPSKLEVRQLTRGHRADNTEQVDFFGLERAAAGNCTSGEQAG